MNPENLCSPSAARSLENPMKWNWMSGEASSGRVRVKMPTVPALTVSGPVRNSRYCNAIRAIFVRLIITSLTVTGYLHL